MADEQQQPGDREGRGADRADGPDQTREFSPFADEEPDRHSGTEPAPGAPPPPDQTVPLPRTDRTAADLPPVDRTAPLPHADRPAPTPDMTAPLPPATDATMPLPGRPAAPRQPGADATAPLPRGTGAWAGRAGVRPPDPTVVRGPVPRWEPVDEPEGRSWLMPVVLGIVALLLLGLLSVGIWLITQSRGGTDPAATTPPPAPAATSASPTPTSAAPTTGEPSPTAPRSVTVPSLVGLSSAQARGALDNLGLTYRLTYRASDVPEGTVIGTDPPAGQEVPEGAQVTLVIATAPATSAAPSGSATPGGGGAPTG